MAECPISYYSNVVTSECESGLSSKIVFFPILITAIVVTFIVIISKCISKSTALITALVAFYSYLELAIWIYVIVLLGAEYLEPDVDYVLPITLISIALGCLVVSNIIFFIINGRKVEED